MIKELYNEFRKVFVLEEKKVNKLFKILLIILFGPSFLGIFIVLLIAAKLNEIFHTLIRHSFIAIGYVLRKVYGVKRLISLPLLVVLLIPFIFSMYVSVIVFRLLLPIIMFFYNLHFLVITLGNNNEMENKMENLIKIQQENDEF